MASIDRLLLGSRVTVIRDLPKGIDKKYVTNYMHKKSFDPSKPIRRGKIYTISKIERCNYLEGEEGCVKAYPACPGKITLKDRKGTEYPVNCCGYAPDNIDFYLFQAVDTKPEGVNVREAI